MLGRWTDQLLEESLDPTKSFLDGRGGDFYRRGLSWQHGDSATGLEDDLLAVFDRFHALAVDRGQDLFLRNQLNTA